MTLQQVSEATGLSKPQLRRWDRLGLVPAVRVGRHRRYGPKQMSLLVMVKGLVEQGWFVREIQALLVGARRDLELRPSEDANAVLRRELKALKRGETLTFDAPDFQAYNSIYKRVLRESSRARRKVSVKKDGKRVYVMPR